MDRLAELLAILSDPEQLARLTDAEVGEFHVELAALFASVRAGEVEDVSPHDVDVLTDIGNGLAACVVESGARFEHAAAAEAAIADIEIAAGLVDPEPVGGDPALDGLAGLTTEELAEVEAYAAAVAVSTEPTGEPGGTGDVVEPEPVVAGAVEPRMVPSLRDLTARAPQPGVRSPRIVVGDRIGADFTWLPDGRKVTAAELPELVAAYPGTRGAAMPAGQKVILAQMDTLAANAQRIDSRFDSPDAISRKLDAAVKGGMDPRNWRDGQPTETLVASGGWGAPAPVVYDVEQLASAERPFEASLPSIGADRGGLTWTPPPLYSDVTRGGWATTNAAVGVWSNAKDITPGSDVKSFQAVPTANAPRTVQLDAVYMSLQEGVLQSRAFPEWVKAWEDNTRAAQSQTSETHLLDLVEASPRIKSVSDASTLSTTRDFLATVILLAAAERRRQRMAPDAMVRVAYPSYLLDMVQVDLLRSGQNFVDQGPTVVARTYIEGQLAAANINGSVYWDSSTNGAQLMRTQAGSGGVVAGLPTTVRWYMWHEGMFVHGTGGTYDVGVIRDADLVETNDYRMFVETFDTIFDRGLWAYYCDSALCPTGTAGAAMDIHTLCAGS